MIIFINLGFERMITFCLVIFLLINSSFSFNLKKSTKLTPKNFIQMSIEKNSLDDVVNLMKNSYSPHGLLSTINYSKNVEGYPFVSLCGFVVSDNGFPIFCLSRMSKHTKNIRKEGSDGYSKASLYIRENNVPWDKKNAMHSKRVTFTGNINKINYDGISGGDEYWEEFVDKYKELYRKIHPDAFWVDFPDFEMYRMDLIKDIYYIGGFSKATKISVEKYLKKFNLDVS